MVPIRGDSKNHSYRKKVYFGWWVVLVAFLGAFVSSGIGGQGLGVFLKPMTKDMGWSRTDLAGVVTLRSIVMGLLGPIFGRIADRGVSGPRMLFVAGGFVAGLSLLMVSFTSHLWQFYVAFGVLFGLGQATFGGQAISGAVISKWFIRFRGRAMSLFTTGISLGGVVFVPLSAVLISQFGWKGAWFGLGLVTWVLIIPLSVKFMYRQPEDIGLLPDGLPTGNGAVNGSDERGSQGPGEVNWTFSEAIRTPTLWLVTLAFNLMTMSIGAVVLHQVPYLTDKGFTLQAATSVAVLFSTFALIAKMPWGILSEKYSVRYACVSCFVLGAFGLLLLVMAESVGIAIAFTVVYGLGAGGEPVLRNVVLADYYGRECQGTIRGAFAPLNAIFLGASPLFAAWVYDSRGDYDLAYLILVAGNGLAALFVLLAKPPKRTF